MIRFKKLRVENFFSVGAMPVEIDFIRNTFTTLTGKNGSGKTSVIFDGLTYALYGKPYRNVKKSQMLNSINGRALLVECEFDTGGKSYLVRRGVKPDLFEIYEDGNLIDQEAANRDYQKLLEDRILCMNAKSFKQVAIISVANYTPFMELSAADRRAIVEDLLDIQIFSTMNEVLAERKSELVEGRNKLQRKIDLLEVEIRTHTEKVESLKAKDQSLVDTNLAKIDEAQTVIQERMAKIEELQTQVETLNGQLSDVSQLNAKKRKLEDVNSRLKSAYTKLNTEIEFFVNHDDCPVCSQKIGDDLRNSMVTTKKEKIADLDSNKDKLYSQLDQIEALIKESEALTKKIQTLNNEIFQYNSSITTNQKYIKQLESIISDIQSKGDDEEQAETAKLVDMQTNLDKAEKTLEKVRIREEDFQVCHKLLKDGGIKAQVIERYLPTLNKVLNHYLELMNFAVSFNFDKSFNEVIRSRYRDEFTYASFSKGEQSRLDFALVMAFREVAKMKNSISTNVLLIDELFENMDTMGIECAINILNGMSDTNTFLVTHKQEFISSALPSINFVKRDGFTMIGEE